MAISEAPEQDWTAAAALVMPCEQCIAAVHGRAADGVFHQVGVDIDMAIIQE